jgi:glycosyltransferase involved in cell wall biosynthesis
VEGGKALRVLYLARYGRLGASSRIRGYQYLPYLENAGIEVVVAPLLPDQYLTMLYEGRKPALGTVFASYARRLQDILQCQRFDALWLEYEAFPWLPGWLEVLLLRGRTPYLVDYDDAIFHRYDLHSSTFVRGCLGSKIDAVMRYAAVVTCGNPYLADRAQRAGAQRVEVLPTVVDLARYAGGEVPGRQSLREIPVIGWIGSPATSHYLEQIHKPLADLSRDGRVRVQLVGARDPNWSDVSYEILPWSEETEAALIKQMDIGVMPLPDSPWERGKCGYKLIQYMACEKPVVASPVGVNNQIVTHGVNGFLAESSEQWKSALERLIDDALLRQRMGAEGRAQIERSYNVGVTAPRLEELLRMAAETKSCVA